MGNPCDCLGLAGTCRMLNQVTLSNAIFTDIFNTLRYTIPLMETRKYLCAMFPDTSCNIFFPCNFLKNKVMEDTEPVVFPANIIPEIPGRVIFIIFLYRRVSRMTIFRSTVKGKELRLFRGKVCTHPDFIFRDGKMNYCASFVHQQEVLPVCTGFNRFTLILVFQNGIRNSLCQFCLDFRCSDRNTVDEEHKVKRLFPCGLVMHLAHYTQDILVIIRFQFRQAGVIRILPGTGNGLVSCHLEAITDSKDSTTGFQCLYKLKLQVVFPITAKRFLQLCHLFRLGRRYIFNKIRHIQCCIWVKAGIVITDTPATIFFEHCQFLGNVYLKIYLKMNIINHNTVSFKFLLPY